MGLSRSDGKRPDGVTLISRDKRQADISDTFAISYRGYMSTRATTVADGAAANKTAAYTDSAKTEHFVPIAVETGVVWNELALLVITETGRRITGVAH